MRAQVVFMVVHQRLGSTLHPVLHLPLKSLHHAGNYRIVRGGPFNYALRRHSSGNSTARETSSTPVSHHYTLNNRQYSLSLTSHPLHDWITNIKLVTTWHGRTFTMGH
jgi:hypothetical protein